MRVYLQLASKRRVDRSLALKWAPGPRKVSVWMPFEVDPDGEGLSGGERDELRAGLSFELCGEALRNLSTFYDKWLREESALDSYVQ